MAHPQHEQISRVPLHVSALHMSHFVFLTFVQNGSVANKQIPYSLRIITDLQLSSAHYRLD